MKPLVLAFVIGMASALATSSALAGMAERASRSEVAGIDVVVYPTSVKNVITVTGFMPAGDAFATDNAAVPALTGMMLQRGTARQDQFVIAQKLEDVAASIDFGVGNQTLNISGQLRKPHLALFVGTLAEELRMPALEEQELDKARRQFVGGLQRQIDDVTFRAREAFERAAYPDGHPNKPVSHRELIAAAKRASVADLKAFHEKHYGPAHMTLIFVGDVSAADVKREVGQAFAGWSGGVPIEKAPTAARQVSARDLTVPLEDKPSLTVILGQRSRMRFSDPESLALRIGTAILGAGFTGRLMSTVRDQEGLTYGVQASMTDDAFADGLWYIDSTFAPELSERGIASLRRELMKWWSEGVTEDELRARKQNLIGSYQVGLASTGGMARAIQGALERGYDLTWLDEYPQAIDAITLEQVNGAIKRHLNPQRMILVKAGTKVSRGS